MMARVTALPLLAALLGSLAVFAPAPAAGAGVDLAKSPGAVRTVPMQFRPEWRWWWPTGGLDEAELGAELEAMKAAGFGAVEQVLLRHPNDWWTPGFRASTKAAVEKATQLGMRFDVTLGPMWPITSKAADDVSKRLSMQEAVFSAVDVVGPSTYSGPLPQVDDNGLKQRTLVAATAARPVDPAAPGVTGPIGGGAAPSVPVVLDPKTAVNLTPQVRDGVLTWQVPAGRWKLVAVWMRPTGQRAKGDALTLAGYVPQQNVPADLPDLGGELGPLAIDHFNRAATDATLKEFDDTLFGGDMASVLRRNGGHVFEDSLELDHVTASAALPDDEDGCLACNGRFWTTAFLDEFRKRRGYDLTPLLPAIYNAFDLPDGGGARVKADYKRTISDLIVANHYEPIRRWANARGLTQRAQGYKLNGTDKVHLSSKLQLPDAESLDSSDTGEDVAVGSPTSKAVIDDYRQVVSGAHLSGAKEVTLEAGANLTGEYDMAVGDYKVIADRAFAGGVTTMALHGFAYRTYQDAYQAWSWPGWSAFNFLFAESWNQAHPAFPQWSGLAGYYGRISTALQSGEPRVDVTVLSAPLTSHTFGSKDMLDALRASDYSWDRLDDQSLAELPVPKGRRILPRGPAYRALVVDSIAALSQAAAEKALAVARAGVPVVIKGDVPARGTSYRDPKSEDAAVKAAFDALLKLPNVKQVKTGKEAIEALAALRVPADLRLGGLPLVAQHRRTPRGDVWFLYNNSPKPASGELRFATAGAPTRIDPWTGAVTRVGEYGSTPGTVSVPMTLAAGETALISFDGRARRLHAVNADGDVVQRGRSLLLRDVKGGVHDAELSSGARRTVQLPDLPKPIDVAGPWALSAATTGPDGDGKVDLKLDALKDWRDIPELSSASGVGTYVAKADVPADWLAAGRRVLLDPGAYGGFANVEVNGRAVALPSLPDGARDVTGALRAGTNELRVRVGTTVTNVIAGSARAGDPRYAQFVKNVPQPYGLIGPVRLVPVAEAKLATVALRCASKRRFAIHVRSPRGFRVRSATLRIGKRTRRVKVTRAGRLLRVVVDLRGQPEGRERVRLVVRGADGRTVRTARAYKLCVRGSKRRP